AKTWSVGVTGTRIRGLSEAIDAHTSVLLPIGRMVDPSVTSRRSVVDCLEEHCHFALDPASAISNSRLHAGRGWPPWRANTHIRDTETVTASVASALRCCLRISRGYALDQGQCSPSASRIRTLSGR